MDYGDRIRELRLEKKDTLESLGKKLNFNYSNLSKIERNVRKPNVDLLEQIAKLYNVPLSYFYGEEQSLPHKLKEKGVKWLAFGEKMEKRDFTPEQVEAILQTLEEIDRLKKKS